MVINIVLIGGKLIRTISWSREAIIGYKEGTEQRTKDHKWRGWNHDREKGENNGDVARRTERRLGVCVVVVFDLEKSQRPHGSGGMGSSRNTVAAHQTVRHMLQ